MQAYKLTGKIDHSGQLIITEPTNLSPGDVEVIILQSATTTENPPDNAKLVRPISREDVIQALTKKYSFDNAEHIKNRPSKVKTFQDWFAKTTPESSSFAPDKAKWDYLKEKHNL